MTEPTLIDARGLNCPAPIILLARRAAGLPAGSDVELLTDDPAAQFDVPAWCHMRQADYLSAEPLEASDPPPAAKPAVRHRIRLPA